MLHSMIRIERANELDGEYHHTPESDSINLRGTVKHRLRTTTLGEWHDNVTAKQWSGYPV